MLPFERKGERKMNFSIRKSDSLAHETGYFKNSVDELKKEWMQYTNQLIDYGPEIINLSRALSQTNEKIDENKKKLTEMLSNFARILEQLEQRHSEHYQLLTEIDGLDFPLKSPEKMLKILEKDQDLIKNMKNVIKNLNKTISFYGNDTTDKELLSNSIKSFEEAFNEYSGLCKEYNKTLQSLAEELKKEHDRAKKYNDFV